MNYLNAVATQSLDASHVIAYRLRWSYCAIRQTCGKAVNCDVDMFLLQLMMIVMMAP
jgi:hypothetical protein